MFRKILVATDFSKPSRAALSAAVSLAERGTARIEAIYVSALGELPYISSPFVVPVNSLQADLQGKLNDFFPAWLYPNSNRSVVIGTPVDEEILNYARKGSFDLIVLGSHGRNAVGRFVLGSITQKVTRCSEIPVMVVRDVEHVENRYQGFDRILAPTDFSETSLQALNLAIEFANFLKADLHHIHVIDLPAISDMTGLYPFLNTMTPPVADMNVDLTLEKDLEGKYVVGNTKVMTLIGDPLREILTYAEEHQIDFIVMGTHGRRGIERLYLGNVTAGIIAKSKFPVITVAMPHVKR